MTTLEHFQWEREKLLGDRIEPAPLDPKIKRIQADWQDFCELVPIIQPMQERNRQIGCLLNLDLTGIKIWLKL